MYIKSATKILILQFQTVVLNKYFFNMGRGRGLSVERDLDLDLQNASLLFSKVAK